MTRAGPPWPRGEAGMIMTLRLPVARLQLEIRLHRRTAMMTCVISLYTKSTILYLPGRSYTSFLMTFVNSQ